MEENLPEPWESILKRIQSIYLTLHGFLKILHIYYYFSFRKLLFFLFLFLRPRSSTQHFLFIIMIASSHRKNLKEKDSFQDEFTVWSFRSLHRKLLYKHKYTNKYRLWSCKHNGNIFPKEFFPPIFPFFLLCFFPSTNRKWKNFCVLPIFRLKREIASGESGFALELSRRKQWGLRGRRKRRKWGEQRFFYIF